MSLPSEFCWVEAWGSIGVGQVGPPGFAGQGCGGMQGWDKHTYWVWQCCTEYRDGTSNTSKVEGKYKMVLPMPLSLERVSTDPLLLWQSL